MMIVTDEAPKSLLNKFFTITPVWSGRESMGGSSSLGKPQDRSGSPWENTRASLCYRNRREPPGLRLPHRYANTTQLAPQRTVSPTDCSPQRSRSKISDPKWYKFELSESPYKSQLVGK
ncbi:hypothetical protein A6770_39200 [Nostoc minutum NIES-26]|uniref:Uncharacterized protein n=1 Tax=Nostoc minutum NIES-26 TaxID=1844469 RepID=A0A367RSR0_9NOSO|nr:hypothetical protein A6770_39200 [Nostoc minutum NIES-26]